MGFAEFMYTLGLLRTVILELGTQYLGASWSAIQLPTILVGLAETLPTASATLPIPSSNRRTVLSEPRPAVGRSCLSE